ncbi:MAG: ATP-dependent metallopeptidase FtsH/Yme1/Tma family protein [Acidobacteria bacterium]|nr:ATP-dependent metallopeptidase FtsH/Yme1/Tma family protein [Acidobacteriota bacterium]
MPPLINRPGPNDPRRGTPLGKLLHGPALYLILILLALGILLNYFGPTTKVKQLSLSEFQSHVQAGRIKSAEIFDKDQRVEGDLAGGARYSVNYPTDYGDDLTNLLEEYRVDTKVNPQRTNPLVGFLSQFLPLILIFLLFMWLVNSMQGGGNRVMSFGKAKARLVTKDMPKITFKDVAGVDEAVEELVEIKEFLENPSKFQTMGAKIPKGVLLYGPPGAGKTLLARAVAGEAGVPFFSISGSDFVEMFVGVGAARVRDLFEQAKTSAPAIVFVDEIDAVGRQRGAGLGGGHDEREQTLNQLLVEMDGFDVKSGVIMIAATNRPDILDPALLRPGRFDRQIVVDRPDLKGRVEILKVHAREKPIGSGADLEVLARRTPGFTGADLANVLNEAALLTARRGKPEITMAELEEAIDRVVAGPERKSRVISEKEKRIIAYHESGHALVGHALPNADPVHKVSIIPRGMALGYTLSLPTEDRFLVTRSELIDELAQLLGGRTAEELVFEDPTTGAQNDITRATKIARQMVTEYGMSERLGPLTLGQKQELVFLGRDLSSTPDYSDHIAFEIDKEIRRLIDEAHDEAVEILVQYRPDLDRIVERLLEKETIEKEELMELLASVAKRAPRGTNGQRPGAGLSPARKSVRRQK